MFAPSKRVFATTSATSLRVEDRRYEVSFDWHALGCPEALCLSLGDRNLKVPLPEGFPAEPLAFDGELEVYDRPQKVALVSPPDRVPRSAAVTLEASGVDTVFGLLAAEKPLLDGWSLYDEWEEGGYLVDPDGRWVEISRRILRGLEKDIVGGAACRPDCRWHSVLVQRNTHQPRLVRREFEEDEVGDFFLIEHFEQIVEYVWHSFHCENGRWVRKDIAVDLVTRSYSVRHQVA